MNTAEMVIFGEVAPEPKKVGDLVEFEEGGCLYFDLERTNDE